MTTLTAADRRAKADDGFDAFMDACPSRALLDRIGDKWVGLVLARLHGGDRRFSELARSISGVSQKMLTQTLRLLERDGLVVRTVTPSVPVRVDYALSDLGRSLMPVLAAVRVWAEANMGQVLANRVEFDASIG